MIPNITYPTARDDTPTPVRATSRLVWWMTCFICLGLILLRLPSIMSAMQVTVADQVSGEGLDPSLVNLSVRIAAYLGVLLFGVVMILYLALAALLENRLLPHGLRILGNQRIGLFCLLIAVLTVSAQVFAFATGALPTGPVEIVWVLLVAVGVPFLFHSYWAGPGVMTPVQRLILFVVSIVISALVALL